MLAHEISVIGAVDDDRVLLKVQAVEGCGDLGQAVIEELDHSIVNALHTEHILRCVVGETEDSIQHPVSFGHRVGIVELILTPGRRVDAISREHVGVRLRTDPGLVRIGE